MYRHGNAVFISNFYWKLKNKKWHYQFCILKEFQTSICVRISFKKIECLFFFFFFFFFGDSNVEEGDE